VIKTSHKGVIITIAREHGSSGKQIGKIVAEKLGIPFYYKEMTALAAQESGLDKEFISDLNANSPTLMHDLYLSTNVVQQAVIAQDKVIRKIADNGSCVIVGRAADFILRDYPDVIRIFIYAPKEFKIQRVMEVYGDDPETAEKNIHRSDEARAAYYRNISGNTWGERRNYELLVDSSAGLEACADVICRYIRSAQSK
ncbi:MAG: cytidylate kinase-like family protein, partial [Lachnospiraceae bacterium]|nr:cytidylate kinase-like family protein [Lachnospiraceae bacterium]